MKTLRPEFYHLKCISCHRSFDEEETVTNCTKCHNPLEVIFDYEYLQQRLNWYDLKHSPISALKYLLFYPIRDLSKIISLNEGGTLLHHCRQLSDQFDIPNLYPS